MKRTQKLVTWGIVILVVLVVLLMLVSNLRLSSRVVLPDTSTTAEDSELPPEGGELTVVEVTPESSIFAFSAASFKRWSAIRSAFRSMLFSFLNSETR